MRLQLFNRGRFNRLAEHLAPVDAGIIYTNIDNEKGDLRPVKELANTGLTLDEWAHYFEAQAEWVSSPIEREYLEYQDTLYWSETGAVPKYYYGTETHNLGIEAPVNIPLGNSSGAGVLIGTYQYLFTFYNSSTGFESPPSPLTVEIIVVNKTIKVTNIQVSTDPQVDQKRLYRVGGASAVLTYIGSINNADIEYLDNTADIDLGNEVLESETYYQAPIGLRYLIEAYGIFFGAVDSDLRFSAVGKPWAWPQENLIQFPATITGLGVIPAGILVFTKLKTFILTGSSIATFNKYRVSGEQGCVSHHSIQPFLDGLIWVSLDGICRSAGVAIELIALPAIGKESIPVKNSVIYNKVYYIQKLDGTIIALDARYEPTIVKDLSLATTNIAIGNNLLLGYKAGIYYELFAGSNYSSLTYKSPLFLDGAYTNRKNFNTIYVKNTGVVSIEIFIDGVSVGSYVLSTDDVHELQWDQKKKNAYSIQFLISGTGIIEEIDWSPEPRKTV